MQSVVLLLLPLALVSAQLQRQYQRRTTSPTRDWRKWPVNNSPFTGTCNKKCSTNTRCEVQECNVCVPVAPTCKTIKCEDNQKCEDRPTGPVCLPLTCADIRCAAGELCNELPDGPDCVPDVPSCKGFYCKRGTNCYIRKGHPICLPNTCEVRECKFGLTCIDTPNGALCRRGQKTLGCSGKYCPDNSRCIDTAAEGAHCVKI